MTDNCRQLRAKTDKNTRKMLKNLVDCNQELWIHHARTLNMMHLQVNGHIFTFIFTYFYLLLLLLYVLNVKMVLLYTKSSRLSLNEFIAAVVSKHLVSNETHFDCVLSNNSSRRIVRSRCRPFWWHATSIRRRQISATGSKLKQHMHCKHIFQCQL